GQVAVLIVGVIEVAAVWVRDLRDAARPVALDGHRPAAVTGDAGVAEVQLIPVAVGFAYQLGGGAVAAGAVEDQAGAAERLERVLPAVIGIDGVVAVENGA